MLENAVASSLLHGTTADRSILVAGARELYK
jgi:hypothetical protein